MVWVKSVKFGCGKARSRTGKIIVVANYEPKVSLFAQLFGSVLLFYQKTIVNEYQFMLLNSTG